MVKKKVNTKKITRESLIKSVAKATMVNSEIVREFFDELEDLIFEHLSSVNENENVAIKLFNGMTLNGVFVPEHKIRNNNVSENDTVPSKIKPRFNITKHYIEKLNMA